MMRFVKYLLGIFLFIFVRVGVGFHTKTPDISLMPSETLSAKVSLSSQISTLSFFSIQSVYAQEEISKESIEKIIETKNTQKLVDNLNTFLKVIYIIIWPLLLVAGLAVDNSMVYGEMFYFDQILWQIWQIMRDIANFSLFFIAMYYIFKALFEGKSDSIKGVVKKLLISGILIQASWFLMGAIIDVSTVFTYSFGALPSVGMSNADTDSISDSIKQRPILKPVVRLRTNEKSSEDISFVYYEYGTKKIPECIVDSFSGHTYIYGKKVFPPNSSFSISDEVSNGLKTQKYNGQDACVYGNKVYHFSQNKELTKATDAKNYSSILQKMKSDFSTGENEGFLDISITTGVIVPYNDNFFTDEQGDKGGKIINNIIDTTQGYAGTFVTLYTSLLNNGNLQSTVYSQDPIVNNFNLLGSFVKKIIFSFLLFVPLLAVAAVLIARIGILWLAIMFLPLLILNWVFEIVKGGENIMKHFDLENLIRIIFAPVIMVFALSLSVIFIQAINKSFETPDSLKSVEKTLNVSFDDQNIGCKGGAINVMGLVELCAELPGGGDARNIFADMLQNLFALGIIWFLLFAAIKSNSIGETIGGAIQNVAQKALGTMPILPIKGGVGWNVFQNDVLSGRAFDKALNTVEQNQQNNLRLLSPSLFGDPTDKTSGKDDVYSKIHYYHLKHPNKNWDSIYDEYGKAAGVGSSEELKHNYENNYVNNVSYTAEDKIYEELAKDVISGKELKDLKTKKKYMQAYINENLIELDDDKLVLKKDKIKDNQAFKKLITAEIEELNKKLEEEKEKGKDKDKKEGYEKEIKKLRKFVVE